VKLSCLDVGRLGPYLTTENMGNIVKGIASENELFLEQTVGGET
jgi:hypothetical protein